jgi:uncharacterized membrane protein HdeD (DUF308 family)
MIWPNLTIAFLVVLFGAYAFIDGMINVIVSLRPTPLRQRSWLQFVQGIVGIAAGVVAFAWPDITVLALLLWIAAWAVVSGVFEIAAAIRLRRVIEREWLLVVAGTLSIIFGVLLFIFPGLGAIGLAWALGAYAAASGLVMVVLAVRLRTRPVLAAS